MGGTFRTLFILYHKTLLKNPTQRNTKSFEKPNEKKEKSIEGAFGSSVYSLYVNYMNYIMYIYIYIYINVYIYIYIYIYTYIYIYIYISDNKIDNKDFFLILRLAGVAEDNHFL